MHSKNLIEKLLKISNEAGQAIMSVYETDNFSIENKSDSSPLTKADKISNQIICDSLKILTPNIPIISEESSDIEFSERKIWEKYWLVDPLDGTKEFINKNGEFTTNIALIEKHIATMGVISIPTRNEFYWGDKDFGSFSSIGLNRQRKINVSKREGKLRILCSRSHPSNELEKYLDKFTEYELIKKGSSIKFCMIAAGNADIYPRLGKTSEWDVAAGSAIVKYAGGSTKTLDGRELEFNRKESYLNQHFIVSN
tara:strand:- start:1613 stop:2374 length:762 start_codon:yes stop_codon:yes gene_type:complete